MRFPECETCLNREFDPFQCEVCEDADHYEEGDDSEELTYAEFQTWLKEAA